MAALAALFAWTALLLGSHLSVITLTLALLGLYRAFNICRLWAARMHRAYLYRVTLRTSLWLLCAQLILGAIALAGLVVSVSVYMTLFIAVAAECLLALTLYLQVRRYQEQGKALTAALTREALPTVSVLIPARNETDSLERCLKALVASDYPKLEILVLDDCSQSTRTPEIIRHYAHDGVRFIQGQEPDATWTAKNHAYAALTEASSGEVLLFAGVDIEFQPQTIRGLVSRLMAGNYEMLGVLPKNSPTGRTIALLQPIRYFLELGLPQFLLGSPAVLSSCWLIRRQALEGAGNFMAVRRMVMPEIYFAHRLAQSDDYIFLTDGLSLGVTSQKGSDEQRATAIRTAYPRLHRRPEAVAGLSLLMVAALGLPLSLMLSALVYRSYLLPALLGGITLLLLFAAYRQVLVLAYGAAEPRSLLSFPLAVIYQLGLLQYSMYKYEFDEVIWKGRNICIPAMHVVPRLPQL